MTEPGVPGLRFGSDDEPGIRRLGTTRVRYVDERTGRVPSAAHRERIRALAVPPAWTDVWIAADPSSHLQATGRDARGRKQYRYHPEFSAGSSAAKFAQLHHFGAGLGGLRRKVQRDLRADGLGHDRVVAVVIRLLDVTSVRVGNESYARDNHSFGLTTLRSRHAEVHGARIQLGFVGKSHRRFDVALTSPVLARLVRRCQDLPGQKLFQYRAADGTLRAVTSQDVNDYLTTYCWPDATAKTFRTWNATVRAAQLLAASCRHDGEPDPATLNGVYDAVAGELGNTRAVCRQSYVHPAVPAAYLDGTLLGSWARSPAARPSGLTVDERRLLRFLRAAR